MTLLLFETNIKRFRENIRRETGIRGADEKKVKTEMDKSQCRKTKLQQIDTNTVEQRI
tara:strand:- start:27518 stop:27691 length:174 start_codon:yes stop_codon:yes gene_type:complete